MENKTITMAKRVSLAADEDQNSISLFMSRNPQKVNEGSFRNEATLLRERQLVTFA